ncbi:Embryogenesis-like protein [Euphorbia peplus]|nr:Embryogenesis-like protein [Euphorbia peplus]
MQKRLQISLYKLLSRHSKPTYGFFLETLTSNPSQTLTPKFLHTSTLNLYPNAFSSTYKTYRNHSTESGGDNPLPDLDVNKEVDMINLKFAEAREEIESAMDSKETVYFNEEAECARAAVNEVLDMFHGLLAKLPEAQKGGLQRSMGLKIEQLKAEIQQLED